MEGGMMGNIDMLYLASKNTTYKINREAKTYSAMTGTDTIKFSDVKITKTSETAKILNYTCTKYTAESTQFKGIQYSKSSGPPQRSKALI